MWINIILLILLGVASVIVMLQNARETENGLDHQAILCLLPIMKIQNIALKKGGLTMHEYLFRGKRKDTGEWVEGYLVIVDKYYYILTGKIEIRGSYVGLEKYLVIPETVGQYIGLLDKIGKKIFEGDVVNAIYKSNYFGVPDTPFGVGVIKYGNSYYSGARYEIDIIGEAGSRVFSDSLRGGVTVIGNIYDNPELLKEEGDKNEK